jgi:flagella basal body P-ring formation protein FlgA
MTVSLLKRAGLALALAALATTAQAEPLLKGDVTVTAAIVTVGVEVGLPLITDLIATDLRTRGILSSGMDMDIALDTPLPELVSANTANPATLTILRYMPGSSTFSARFQIGGIDRPLDVSGQIQLLIAAPHLTRTLPQGTILSPDDVEMRMIPLPYAESAGLVAVEQLVGKALQRQTRAGVMLRPSDIAAPEIISRNEQVTVVYQHGSLTLTTTGKALNAASLSEPVTVLNTMSNKVLQGIATQNGTVTIVSGPQQIAGL